MTTRPSRVLVPETTAKRVTLMALERGKLQEYLVADDAPLPSRTLRAMLRTISSLPPVRRRVARSQLRSRFVDALLAGMRSTPARWLTRL